MQTYFADTWYFVALHDRFDNHHARAMRIQERFSRSEVVTHDAVLTEMLAYFSDGGAQARVRAAQTVRNLLQDIEVVVPTRDLFARALDLYARRPDKEYSLVDCMSMIVMRDRGISHVLTNDHHFRQEGFEVISDVS
jgi:uncharacterized protein